MLLYKIQIDSYLGKIFFLALYRFIVLLREHELEELKLNT